MSTFLFHDLTVQIEKGDITRQQVDAVVNAANSRLLHGGGVAAAISARGGPAIQEESLDWVKLHGPVTSDRPAITGPGSLPCRYVIHAVGPVWGEGYEVQKLTTAVRACLITANDLKCTSIAFPAISTGIFGFPSDLASRCFHEAILDFSSRNLLFFLHLVKLVLFDDKTFHLFNNTFTDSGNNSL